MCTPCGQTCLPIHHRTSLFFRKISLTRSWFLVGSAFPQLCGCESFAAPRLIAHSCRSQEATRHSTMQGIFASPANGRSVNTTLLQHFLHHECLRPHPYGYLRAGTVNDARALTILTVGFWRIQPVCRAISRYLAVKTVRKKETPLPASGDTTE